MKILVAGVGNIFLGDDGFGVEVAQALSKRELPQTVTVKDLVFADLTWLTRCLIPGTG